MTLIQTPPTAISRPLGALEKLFWLADQNRPTHFAIAAEVGGSTRIEQWQDALDRVCRQSALIWSRIVRDKHGAPVFMPVPYGSIPLDVVENAISEWTAHVAGEIHQPFDTSSAPLLRAKLLHGADRAVIILCVHHAIADALALCFLMRDVLRALAGEPVRLSTETASIEHLVAARRATLAMPQAEATPAARPPMPYRPLDGSTPLVEALRLTRETTRALRERARLEQSTLHGALSAAVTAAASTLVPGWSELALRVVCPIDVRRRMLNGSEHIGFCVTAVVVDAEGSAPDFWSMARSFSDRLEPAKSVEGISAMIGLAHDLVSPISTVQEGQEVFAQALGAEILLTNLGAVEFRDSFGPLTLHALWGPSVHPGFAMTQTVGAVTVGDRLHLLHTSYEPAKGLLGEVSSLLNAALREGPGRDPKPASAGLATRSA
ncbi:MAG: Condensation domain protein [Bradyrhizobium sp.]|nr:Condensation domain protein [Bradyrhizobium sp.]